MLTACSNLRYKPIVVYGFLIRKERIRNASYIHFRDRIFHRIAEPKNSGLVVVPPEHTLLLAELTCERGDDRWNGSNMVTEQIVRDFQTEGLAEPEDIIECHHFNALHGYPVFRLGFEPHLQTIRQFLGQFPNLRSSGRQGEYAYLNMHSAMRAGMNAAEEIILRH